jgi:hypothetical protein
MRPTFQNDETLIEGAKEIAAEGGSLPAAGPAREELLETIAQAGS